MEQKSLPLVQAPTLDDAGAAGGQDTGAKDYGIDYDVNLIVQPIRLTYRPMEIQKLVNFFYVEDLKPETRREAEKLKRSLASKFQTHVKQSIEMHELRKRKNKVRVEITCPVLEVPFCNNPQWCFEQEDGPDAVYQVEEKWVIAMGDLLLTNFKEGKSQNEICE